MIIIRSRYMPPVKRYHAINLLGVMFVHPDVEVRPSLVNHERIHTAQMRELLYLPFYLLYLLEWLIRLLMRGNAYRNISFEREAYGNMYNPDYLSRRRRYAWLHFISKNYKQRKNNSRK